MARLQGFPPIGAEWPRILILGAFPSVASLERREYYGHGRNQFWTILGSILGFDPGAPYAERVALLGRSGVALWDLIASCEREGSLDQAIRDARFNPILEFVAEHRSIERLALNGGTAAASFIDHVAPELRKAKLPIGEGLGWRPAFAPERLILLARLPSTSPVPTRDYRRALDKLPSWSSFLG